MKFIRADADFRAEAQFAAVVEARAGVDHHRRRIDRRRETPRRRQIVGDDRVGVARTVTVDVGDRLLQPFHHLDGQNEIEKLGREIFFRGGRGVGDVAPGDGAAAQLDAASPQGGGHARQEGRGCGRIDQQTLDRVANAGPLTLAVDHNALRHVRIGALLDVDVTVALVVLEDRHPRLLGHAADQPLAAARDGQVDPFVQPQEVAHGRPIRRRHQLHGVGRQAGVGQGVRQDAMQGDVGMHRLAAAAQDDGVAALDAQAGRVHRHVGPRFVDEKDHAERNADFVDLQTVGPDGAGANLSHRVRQGRHLAQAGGGVAQSGRGQPQSIHLRRRQAGLGGAGRVFFVGGEEIIGPFH